MGEFNRQRCLAPPTTLCDSVYYSQSSPRDQRLTTIDDTHDVAFRRRRVRKFTQLTYPRQTALTDLDSRTLVGLCRYHFNEKMADMLAPEESG